jgi:hypothetical protein
MSKLFLMSGMPVLLCAARQTGYFPVVNTLVNRPEISLPLYMKPERL